jgi:Raf kinase inhibitor-like YbhB/YbcL family protein
MASLAPVFGAVSLHLNSTAFRNNSYIPRRFTAEGENFSPPLEWCDPPAGTKSLAIACEDLDTTPPFLHWLIYKIAPHTTRVSEAIPASPTHRPGSTSEQGKNSLGKPGYFGPKPPEGDKPHRYRFTLYALSSDLPLAPGAELRDFQKVITDKVIAESSIIGLYRPEQNFGCVDEEIAD